MQITIDLSHVLGKDQFDSLRASVEELADCAAAIHALFPEGHEQWSLSDINKYLLARIPMVHAIRLLLANMTKARINIDELLGGQGILTPLIVKDVATQMLGSPPEPEVYERHTHFEERLQGVVVRAHFNRQRNG